MKGGGVFAIVEKKTGKLVGSCGIHDVDKDDRFALCKWWVAPEY